MGHTAPDWGGPKLSMLKLSLESRGEATVLKVSETVMGRLGKDPHATEQGWRQLFGGGLKRYVEEST